MKRGVSKHFVTSLDVLLAAQRGDSTLEVAEGVHVTPGALKLAGELGVDIAQQNSGRAVVSGRSERFLDLLIRDGIVVIPGTGPLKTDVGIKDGRIASLGQGVGLTAARTIDARGLYVFPGIVDPHVHLGLFAPLEEELRTETRSALIGGVTTVGWFVSSPGSYLEQFPSIVDAVSRLSAVDVIPHLVLTEENHLAELPAYVRDLGVTSFKVYMAGIPGIIESADDGFIYGALKAGGREGKGTVICIHAENPSLIERETARLKDLTGDMDAKDWADTRPGFGEEEAIRRASFLAARAGGRPYFVHVSSREGANAVRTLKGDGLCLYAETTSPYLTLGGARVRDEFLKMVPPIRGTRDAESLWRGVVDGVFDAIGTDNVTMTLAEKKASQGVREALPGYPALATHLPSLLSEGVNKRGISVSRIVEMTSSGPAKVFGVFPEKGAILPGSDADLVLVDLQRAREVRAPELLSRSDFSLFEGSVLKGWPVMTIKSGRIVMQDGQLTPESESMNCRVLLR